MSYPEERDAISKLLHSFENPTIVELGAHEGEDTQWMVDALAGKLYRFFCVEADPKSYERLVEKNLPIVPVFGAIAPYTGTTPFYHSKECGGGYGSIYEPLDGLSVAKESFKKIGPVPCFTFSQFCEEQQIQSIDLLYMDIHGAERDVLFCREASNARHIFMEYFNVPVYRGMATKNELLELLGPAWVIEQEFPWNLLLRRKFANKSTCQYLCFHDEHGTSIPQEKREHWANNACTPHCRPCPNAVAMQVAGIHVCIEHARAMGCSEEYIARSTRSL